MEVIFGEDYIEITNNGDEVVHWLKEEWEAEPEIVFSIVNAVKLALTNPKKLYKLLGKKKV